MGIQAIHAGIIGEDGRMLTKIMKEAGVNISPVQILQERSGEAVIEIEKSGNNRIIVYGRTNQLFTEEYIEWVLKEYGEPGDIVLLQNEVNLVSYMITKAHEYGMKGARQLEDMEIVAIASRTRETECVPDGSCVDKILPDYRRNRETFSGDW